MATLTMSAPSPYQQSRDNWEDSRPMMNIPTRARPQVEKVELPPIRQVRDRAAVALIISIITFPSYRVFMNLYTNF
jgi:hypothetical protein